jgi:hypothetical protein
LEAGAVSPHQSPSVLLYTAKATVKRCRAVEKKKKKEQKNVLIDH